MKTNNKNHPIWNQFVVKQKKWVGGILQDYSDCTDNILGLNPISTKIKKIDLKSNKDNTTMFIVGGDDFDCGFDVRYGKIINGENGWITFNGYNNHIWRIKMT